MTTNKLNFAEINSPEHDSWKAHRQLVVSNVTSDDAGYRGCLGLGLMVNSTDQDSWINVVGASGDKMFLPDGNVRWLAMTDIPLGFFRLGDRTREAHWATIRPTTMKFGMPVLAKGTEEGAWDFRAMPYDTAMSQNQDGERVEVSAPTDVLSPSRYPQLFRAFNCVEWAMSSTAFNFRSSWKQKRQAMFEALGMKFEPDNNLLLFGPEPCNVVERPEAWMPRPYLAFEPSLRYRLWERCTRVAGSNQPFYSSSLVRAVIEDVANNFSYAPPFPGRIEDIVRETYDGMSVTTLHLTGDLGERTVVRFTRKVKLHKVNKRSWFTAGQIIASEPLSVPQDWNEKSPRVRWERWLPKMADTSRFDTWLRVWFERQLLDIQGDCLHAPASVASTAAYYHALDERLYWDVSPCMKYFVESCDTFVFPTVQIPKWDCFVGGLTDIAYDLTPGDRRFISMAEVKARKDAASKTKKPNKTKK